MTDGEGCGSKRTPADCARISRDLLASELFTLALVGVGTDVNFEHLAKSMGIPPGCILWERDATPSGCAAPSGRARERSSRAPPRASSSREAYGHALRSKLTLFDV